MLTLKFEVWKVVIAFLAMSPGVHPGGTTCVCRYVSWKIVRGCRLSPPGGYIHAEVIDALAAQASRAPMTVSRMAVRQVYCCLDHGIRRASELLGRFDLHVTNLPGASRL